VQETGADKEEKDKGFAFTNKVTVIGTDNAANIVAAI
jgi:hypothetical protein